MSNLKWAIIGPGSIATEFAAALNDIGGTLYAVGSRSLEKAQAFASQYGAERLMTITAKCCKIQKLMSSTSLHHIAITTNTS